MSVDQQVLDEVVVLIAELAGDWEYDEPVLPDTRFLADLGLESLDLVVLGASLQQQYGALPFAEFLATLGDRPVDERDVTVAELVEFVTKYRPSNVARMGR